MSESLTKALDVQEVQYAVACMHGADWSIFMGSTVSKKRFFTTMALHKFDRLSWQVYCADQGVKDVIVTV